MWFHHTAFHDSIPTCSLFQCSVALCFYDVQYKASMPIQKLQGCCMLVRLWQGSGKVVARM